MTYVLWHWELAWTSWKSSKSVHVISFLVRSLSIRKTSGVFISITPSINEPLVLMILIRRNTSAHSKDRYIETNSSVHESPHTLYYTDNPGGSPIRLIINALVLEWCDLYRLWGTGGTLLALFRVVRERINHDYTAMTDLVHVKVFCTLWTYFATKLRRTALIQQNFYTIHNPRKGPGHRAYAEGLHRLTWYRKWPNLWLWVPL
jgi:hypothetical protein